MSTRKKQHLHDFLWTKGYQLNSINGIGQIGQDGVWTREPVPRLVPDSEPSVWAFLFEEITAQHVLETCMARMGDDRLTRFNAAVEAARAVSDSDDKWLRGDTLATVRRIYRDELTAGQDEMPAGRLRQEMGKRVSASLYLTAECFAPELRLPDVSFSVYDTARKRNEDRSEDARLSAAELADLVRRHPSVSKIKAAMRQ